MKIPFTVDKVEGGWSIKDEDGEDVYDNADLALVEIHKAMLEAEPSNENTTGQ
jgi:hypothetical protein